MTKHVVSIPSTPFSSASGSFEVHQVPAAQDNLVWLFVCKRTGAVAAVDGPDAENALAYCQANGLKLTHVLNTHTHGDHIGINRDLAQRGLLDALEVIGPAKVSAQVPGITQAVDEGDEIQVGACRARVLLTEGHIEGHICFLFEDVLFAGDTLFTGGCGRVFTGDFGAMFRGLSKLRALPGETRVCCAHEYTQDNLAFASTLEPDNRALQERVAQVNAVRSQGRSAVPGRLAEERATNPMLRWDSPELQREVERQSPGVDLSSPQAIFTATRKLKDSGAYKRAVQAP
ncbi:MAG: hydroxyacylglutathione hydrolase [Myxococcales bacterium]